MPTRKPERTYSGERPDQVRSALQKAIRRRQVDDAIHWAVEMTLSGEEWWLRRTLLVICSEDVGPAWTEGPAVIGALYGNWRTTSEWLMTVHAVILLCRAPKSRIVDDALAAHLMGHEKEMRRAIPDGALDLHTVAGRYKLGRTEDSARGQEHWWNEAGKLENEVADPEAERYKELTRRWWAEHRPYSEARKPEEFQKPPKTDYQLPLGVEKNGENVRVPGSMAGDLWEVDTTRWTCTCPAFVRWPPCKHVTAVKALVKTEGGRNG
jgi:hypothetical protein